MGDEGARVGRGGGKKKQEGGGRGEGGARREQGCVLRHRDDLLPEPSQTCVLLKGEHRHVSSPTTASRLS